MNIFIELSLILAIVTAVSFLMRALRQPLVVGYILTGVIVGPYFLNILHTVEYVELFSRIGITILLFIVGLSLNPLVIKEVGKISLITGMGQVLFTSFIGFYIIKLLGYGNVAAVYGAIALTFSSTIIILKLLSDKGDLNKLYGKISIGFLLVQDIIATLILLVVSTFSLQQSYNIVNTFVGLLGKGIGIILILFIISRYIIPKVSNYFASSQELLFIFSIAWGLGVASIFATLGFSIEVGALIAGVSLSVSPFSYEIGSRMKPLRDFFIILFFILLGSQMILEDISSLVLPAIILSLFVLIGNPLIVLILMNLLGYKRRVGFMAGLTVAQISEFSLILVSMALFLGHINQEIVSLITLVGIITITGSTYMILYSDVIYNKTKNLLKFFEIRKKHIKEGKHQDGGHDVIIFGYDRVGNDFLQAVKKLDKSYLVVDFNPISIRRLQEKDIPFRFGDAEDVEFLDELGLNEAKLVISTIPGFEANLLLVKKYRSKNPFGIIIVLSHNIKHAEQLYLAGATYVVMPHYLGAHHAASMISRHGLDVKEFEKERNLHLVKLSKRDS
jgi:Kef-type K+ transport system membrane component KefB